MQQWVGLINEKFWRCCDDSRVALSNHLIESQSMTQDLSQTKSPNIPLVNPVCLHQRWPETLFQIPTPLLFQNFWIRVRVWQFFKFENLTPVQTPATVIDPTKIYPCFYLRNDHRDSCYCRNWKVTADPDPFFPKFVAPDPDPKEHAESAGVDSGTPDPVPPLVCTQKISFLAAVTPD